MNSIFVLCARIYLIISLLFRYFVIINYTGSYCFCNDQSIIGHCITLNKCQITLFIDGIYTFWGYCVTFPLLVCPTHITLSTVVPPMHILTLRTAGTVTLSLRYPCYFCLQTSSDTLHLECRGFSENMIYENNMHYISCTMWWDEYCGRVYIFLTFILQFVS